jgi:hypothetical protein
MRYYFFLESGFTDPIVTGEMPDKLSRPKLDLFFTKEFLKFWGGRGKPYRLKIVVQLHFIVKDASGYQFDITTKTFFEVKDRENIVVSDLNDMEHMALESLRKLLNHLIGREYVSKIPMEIPEVLKLGKNKIRQMRDFVQKVQGTRDKGNSV